MELINSLLRQKMLLKLCGRGGKINSLFAYSSGKLQSVAKVSYHEL